MTVSCLIFLDTWNHLQMDVKRPERTSRSGLFGRPSCRFGGLTVPLSPCHPAFSLSHPCFLVVFRPPFCAIWPVFRRGFLSRKIRVPDSFVAPDGICLCRHQYLLYISIESGMFSNRVRICFRHKCNDCHREDILPSSSRLCPSLPPYREGRGGSLRRVFGLLEGL